MTAQQIEALNSFIKKATEHMLESEVKRGNFLNEYAVVIHTDQEGYRIVEKFLVSAPINMALLLTEVASLQDATRGALALSQENDTKAGLTEPSELTKKLTKIAEGQVNEIKVVQSIDRPENIKIKLPPSDA